MPCGDLVLPAINEAIGGDVDIPRLRGYLQMRDVDMPIGAVEPAGERYLPLEVL